MEREPAEVDVVVAGSGAAGMTAALTAAHLGLSVLVIEKTGFFGGSTARSGGGIWAPGNTVLRDAGVTDTPEQARAYLAYVASGVPAGRREALIEHGPDMLSLVLAMTPLRFAWVPGYADYYPEAPGGLAAGRSIEPVPLDGRVLGAELAHLGRPYLPSPVAITQAEYRWLSLGRHPRAVGAGLRVAARAARTRLLGHRMLSLGQALAAGLRAGLLASGVPVWLDTPLTGLEVRDGRVTGVRATRGGEPVLIRARRGVLLASGGFERNEEMRRQYQRAGAEWTTGAAGNTGDGIRAGLELGAATGLMDDAWWGPSIPLPGGPYFCLAERSLPGCVLVNAAGQRFVNESAPYVDAVHAMYDADTPENPHIPAWLVFDQRYRDRYVFAGLPPRQAAPPPLVRRRGGGPRGRPGRARPRGGRGRRGPGQDREQVQRVRRGRPGRGLRPRRLGLRPLLRRPAQGQPQPGPAGPAAVLRRQDRPRRPGHQGRPEHRRAGPGAPRGRHRDRGPVRRGQRERVGDGPQLRRRRRDDRPGHDVRLHRRPHHGGRAGRSGPAYPPEGDSRSARRAGPCEQGRTRRVAMAETTPFTIGAGASCTDGGCGKVNRVVVDPLTRTVTHLVVEPKRRHGSARLVPLDLVDATTGDIRLRCTLAEFEELDPAEETRFLPGTSGYEGYDQGQVLVMPYYNMGMADAYCGPMTVTYDAVPLGEVEVRRGEHVHATDGHIGKVQGLVIDPESHHVTHVLLQEGHLWGRKEVAIPISAVTGVDDGIRLNITKHEVQDLPPVDIHHLDG